MSRNPWASLATISLLGTILLCVKVSELGSQFLPYAVGAGVLAAVTVRLIIAAARDGGDR